MERRETSIAREELSATIQALRTYYEGQRIGVERARAAAGISALVDVDSGNGDQGGRGVVVKNVGDVPAGQFSSPTRVFLLRGKGK